MGSGWVMGRFSCSADSFDRRRNKFEAASFGTVRLSDDEMNAEPGFDQLFERGDGEARRAAENEIEGLRHDWVI